ncbi:hypothetical protein JXA85_00100 [Candidatus Woesearchaeota archaeon]|nr:hypothetical protein [Candidatus Woesearchaeota archaeon]
MLSIEEAFSRLKISELAKVWQNYLKKGDSALFIGTTEFIANIAGLVASGVSIDSIMFADPRCFQSYETLLDYLRTLGFQGKFNETVVGNTLRIRDYAESDLCLRLINGNVIQLPKLDNSRNYDFILAPNVLNDPGNKNSTNELVTALFEISNDGGTWCLKNSINPLGKNMNYLPKIEEIAGRIGWRISYKHDANFGNNRSLENFKIYSVDKISN